jgi:hypothetical protein
VLGVLAQDTGEVRWRGTPLAARIYNRAVLRMGAPIKLLQAVRLAR